MYNRDVWVPFDYNAYWEVAPVKVVFLGGIWQQVATTNEERAIIYDAIMADMNANANSFIAWPGSFLQGYRGSYLVSNSGTPSAPLTLDDTLPRVKSSNAPFAPKVRAGTIVVSDYDSDMKVSITAYPVMNDSILQTSYTAQNLEQMNLFPTEVSPINPLQKVMIISNMKIRSGRVRIGYRHLRQDEASDPFAGYDINTHFHKVVRNTRAAVPINGALVTEALASANHGQFDALANLAELPETVLQLFSGVSKILRMYKEAKAKDVRIQNSLSRALKAQLPNAARVKLIADAARASSDIWLTYRLGIKPLADTIDDLIDLSFNGIQSYYRYRSFGKDEFDVAYPDDPFLPLPFETRCFIKRRYLGIWDALGWSSLGAVWELVPLSFVIDRYIQLGNFIVAHTTPDLSVEQGATYSWKCSATVSGVHSVSKVHFSVTVSSYKRKVINPYRFCGLSYPPTRTPSQKLDHLALIWNLLLDDIVRPNKRIF